MPIATIPLAAAAAKMRERLEELFGPMLHDPNPKPYQDGIVVHADGLERLFDAIKEYDQSIQPSPPEIGY